ncbi:hypothetical protein BN128_350 [Cronobacter sakazakii 696]|nr:hypothetical protein BN128_350 [Cronobacter sakazakii 696]
MHGEQNFHYAFEYFIVGRGERSGTQRQHLNRALRRGKAFQTALAKRVNSDNSRAALRDFAQRAEHTRMISAGIMTDAQHQIAVVEIVKLYGAFADADRFWQADAGRFVAHVGAIREVVGAIFAGEQLPQECGFVRGAPRGVKLHAVRVVIAAQALANLLKRRFPFNRLIGIASRVVFHRVRQSPLAFQLKRIALPQFADGMRREKFGRGAFAGGLPGDRFRAVFAKFKRRGVLRIGPGAARAVKPLRLVDFEQGNHVLLHRHLAADSVSNGLQCAPASRRSAIRRDADSTISLFHSAPHSLSHSCGLSLVQKMR